MSHGVLITQTAITIVGIVVLVVWARINPVVVLVLGALYLGLAGGLGPEKTAKAVSDGFGNLMAEVGLIIGFGVLLGAMLSAMGTLQRVVGLVLRLVGARRSPYALGLASGIVLPAIYFDVALVMLAPMAASLAERGRRSIAPLAGALAIGLEVGLLMVLPGAAALAVAGSLDVPLGVMLLWGVPFGIVAIGLSVLVHSLVMRRTWNPARDEEDVDDAADLGLPGASDEVAADDPRHYPLVVALLPVLVPLVLIVVATVTDAAGVGTGVFGFLGDPVVALLIGLLVAFGLGVPVLGRDGVEDVVSSGAATSGVILLFTGVAGSLGEVITQTGVGDILSGLFSASSSLPLLLAWVVAAVLRLAQGSGSVAAITAASLLAPVVADIGSPAVLVGLAAASGAAFGGQVSDNSFWMFKTLLGLSTRGTFQVYTLAQSILSVVGLALVLVIGVVA